jgi:cytochrome c-type biogenesis protein CcmH
MTKTPARSDEPRRQLAQLDELIASGVLSGETVRAQRERLLREIADPVVGATEARPSRRLIAGITAFVLAFGVAGYAWHGDHEGWSAGPGDAARAAAESAPADAAQIEATLAKLAEALKARPDDAVGWAMLARSYAALGRAAEALPAYKRVLELKPRDAQALADYADALAVVNNGSLDGEPEKLVLQAIGFDPVNLKALSLAGMAAFNRADYGKAVMYWERAVQASAPDSGFAAQLQGALAEARKRSGAPVAAAAASASVSGEVVLSAALKAQAAPTDTVYVFARAVQGPKMPLAILRLQVKDLPARFTLDDSLAMSPAAKLSSASQVIVGARISRSGNPLPQPGDLQGFSAAVPLGATGLRVEIAEPVR